MRALLALVIVPSLALAEVPLDRPTAIEVDREATPPGRPELGFDGGAPLGGGWAAALGFGYVDRPIAFTTSGGTSHPVERRESLVLAAALALGEATVIDARLPLSHQVGDRLRLPGGAAGERELDRWAMNDLVLGLRFRVVHRPAWSVFARGELGLPTGDSGDFAGGASWNVAWSLIGRIELPGVTLAAAAGIRLRGDEVIVGDRIASNELTGAAGIAIAIPPIRPLWCARDQVKLTAELAGAFGDEVAGAQGPSPLEARVGLVTQPRAGVTFGVRVGAGLVSDEIGAPRWRAMLVIAFAGTAKLGSLLPSIGEPDDGSDDDVTASR